MHQTGNDAASDSTSARDPAAMELEILSEEDEMEAAQDPATGRALHPNPLRLSMAAALTHARTQDGSRDSPLSSSSRDGTGQQPQQMAALPSRGGSSSKVSVLDDKYKNLRSAESQVRLLFKVEEAMLGSFLRPIASCLGRCCCWSSPVLSDTFIRIRDLKG
jgi:hypothetical protein